MQTRKPKPSWYKRIRAYRASDLKIALRQTTTTIGVYIGLWAFMIFTVVAGYPYWVTFLAVVPSAFVLVRLFILFHDCTHGSLFPSRRLNVFFGHLTGILTFTPFETWRKSHLLHHATNAQLDHRGFGDVWTMTVDEYRASSLPVRLKYRVFRNPLAMFLFGPLLIFGFTNRISGKGAKTKERADTILTNLTLAAIVAGGCLAIGVVPFMLIQLPILLLSGSIGIWLFYVQHQFDPGYWQRDERWDDVEAALQGSSFYDMPAFFQWLFGNIGIHHLHHLLPLIPNYRLKACYRDNPEVQVAPLSVRGSLSSLRLHLWDEIRGRFLSFRDYRRTLPARHS